MTLQTRYEFTLPRGFVSDDGVVHRKGTMRLATARDELEPLRDPMVDGPDDPRLTIVVLARVVERLGSLELVTAREIEGLFAVDLAFLQDFYGVINFGSQEDYEALVQSQQDLLGSANPTATVASSGPAPSAGGEPVSEAADGSAPGVAEASSGDGAGGDTDDASAYAGVGSSGGRPRPGRSAIEEIPGGGR